MTRRAFVTGAGSGIGQATAMRLARDGIEVIGADVDRFGLSETQSLLEASGHAFASVSLDVADSDAVRDVVTSVGDLDIVVNVAGILLYETLERTTEADVRRLMDVNLVGTFSVCRAAAPSLARRQGCIVNVASSAALNGRAYLAAYSASKGAVVALSRALAVELAPDVRVNVVCPGGVETPMTSGMELPSGADPVRLDRHPALVGRRATPDEIAGTISFLASPDASFATGATLLVDGGAAA